SVSITDVLTHQLLHVPERAAGRMLRKPQLLRSGRNRLLLVNGEQQFHIAQTKLREDAALSCDTAASVARLRKPCPIHLTSTGTCIPKLVCQHTLGPGINSVLLHDAMTIIRGPGGKQPCAHR